MQGPGISPRRPGDQVPAGPGSQVPSVTKARHAVGHQALGVTAEGREPNIRRRTVMAEHKHHLAGHREHEQIVAALADPVAWFMRELLHAAAASGRHDRAQTHPPRRSPPAWPCCLAARPRPHACRGGGKLAGWRRAAGARQVVGVAAVRCLDSASHRTCAAGSAVARVPAGAHTPQAAGRVRSGLLPKDQSTATVRPPAHQRRHPCRLFAGPRTPRRRRARFPVREHHQGRRGLVGQGSLRRGGWSCHDGVPRSGPTGGGQSRETGS